MSALVLDAGALMALERHDRATAIRLDEAVAAGRAIRTHPLVLAQVWRGGTGRQARLARALRVVEVVPLDEPTGRRVGMLLGAAAASDPVDAAVVDLARSGDVILSSDPGDLLVLVEACGRSIAVVAC